MNESNFATCPHCGATFRGKFHIGRGVYDFMCYRCHTEFGDGLPSLIPEYLDWHDMGKELPPLGCDIVCFNLDMKYLGYMRCNVGPDGEVRNGKGYVVHTDFWRHAEPLPGGGE